jgi:hypothetical protein
MALTLLTSPGTERSGTLTVPQGGIYEGAVVSGEESGVFTLLQFIDRPYRKLPREVVALDNAPSARPSCS